MLTDKPYEILEDDKFGNRIIKLTSNDYSGIMYHYGKVNLIEENEHLRIKFEHDVVYNIKDIDVDNQDFKNHIGDILVELLEEGLLKNEVVFSGGTE